jgi:hypothetical protein
MLGIVNWKECKRKRSFLNIKLVFRNILGEAEKNSRSPGRDMVPGPQDYEPYIRVFWPQFFNNMFNNYCVGLCE